MSEVERRVDASLSCGREEVGDERKWIPIFFRDFVKTTEIDAEAEGAILLTDEKNGVSEITEDLRMSESLGEGGMVPYNKPCFTVTWFRGDFQVKVMTMSEMTGRRRWSEW